MIERQNNHDGKTNIVITNTDGITQSPSCPKCGADTYCDELGYCINCYYNKSLGKIMDTIQFKKHKEKMISQTDLNNFQGTEQYHKDFMNLLLTDGVAFVRDTLHTGWLISDIAVINAMDKKILKNREDGNNFLIVDLILNKENKSAVLYIAEDKSQEDGYINLFYKQEYTYTDVFTYYDGNELNFYLQNGVLLLTSEY